QIDMLGPGTARVRLTVIAPPANAPTPYPLATAPGPSAPKVPSVAKSTPAPPANPQAGPGSSASTPTLAPAPPSLNPSTLNPPANPSASSPPPVLAIPRYAVQAAAFVDRDRAEMFREKMADAYADARTRVDSSRTPALWRVVVGREMTKEQADELA